MSIRPIDLQVAVPKMAEVDKVHKAHEQPLHDLAFANEVKQMLVKKEREVQRQDDVQQAMIRKREKRDDQRHQSESRDSRHGEKQAKSDSDRLVVSDGLRGSKLDIRV